MVYRHDSSDFRHSIHIYDYTSYQEIPYFGGENTLYESLLVINSRFCFRLPPRLATRVAEAGKKARERSNPSQPVTAGRILNCFLAFFPKIPD